jgi:predicted DCC family thiol-disulfide oxidoreductase YuxK
MSNVNTNHTPSADQPVTGWRVKMLYDGACPVCSREVRYLKRRAQRRGGAVTFEDISDPHFDARPYGMTRKQLHRRIHGQLADGTLIQDLEVFRRVYRELGLGWLLAWTRLPLVRHVANLGYTVFASMRPLLQSSKSCATGQCATSDVTGSHTIDSKSRS